MFMETLAAPTVAPSKAEPTKIDVLEHAKEIAQSQGAVSSFVRYWESEDGKTALGYPTPATLADYRHCRVCIGGAATLAAVRLGYDDPDDRCAGDWLVEARGVVGDILPRQIENTAEIVRILDAMIQREKAVAAA